MASRRHFLTAVAFATLGRISPVRLADREYDTNPSPVRGGREMSRPQDKRAYGSGYFGEWIEDQFGLPAYNYTCDQVHDRKAITPVYKVWRSPTDQTHQVGNDRLVAAASNYGYVQVRQDEGSPKFLNDYFPEGHLYGGGIGYLTDGTVQLSTYYPGNAESFERVFGMGYLRKKVRGNECLVDQVIFAPFGDDPLLVSQVTIGNLGAAPVTLRWVEYWGCQMYQFSFRSYMEASIQGDAKKTPELRRRFAARFAHEFEKLPENAGLRETKRFLGRSAEEEHLWQEVESKLSARHEGWLKFIPKPPNSEVRMEDLAPPATFIVSLDGPADAMSSNAEAFFGKGGVNHPEGLARELDGDLSTSGCGSALLLERRMGLQPGENRTLYFAYGYLPQGFQLDRLLDKYSKDLPTLWERSSAQWRADGLRLSVPNEPWVERETAWDNYYLRSGRTYDSFFQEHLISQGGTYQYLQGFQGEEADMIQHTLPSVFADPTFAKEVLGYTLKEVHPDGSIPYGIVGNGTLVPWREVPSDQVLYLLWLAADYVLGTRDTAFLDEEVAAYPLYGPQAGKDTVRHLLARCYSYFVHKVGNGEHGLTRLLNADQKDNLNFWAEHSGYPVGAVIPTAESMLNAAMTCYVLDYSASLFNYMGNSALGADARKRAEAEQRAVRAQWTGRWFPRAYLTPEKGWIGVKHLWLSPQSWTIVGNAATPGQRRELVQVINAKLRQPSPIGALRAEKGPGGGADSDVYGVWRYLNTVLIWALALTNGEMAWDEWKKNSLARHAEVYPDVWYGIWSGPDYFNSVWSKYPGEVQFDPGLLQPKGARSDQGPVYNSSFNDTDFPVMNMHRHANPLYSIVKLLGVEFTETGMTLTPALPLKEYRFKSPLVGLQKTAEGYEGWYAPLTPGTWRIILRPTAGETARLRHIEVNGSTQMFRRTPEGGILLSGESSPGKPLRWSARA